MKVFRKSLIEATVITFALGSAFHFLYDLLGENKVVGLFCPVSESVWEHLKMLVYPSLIGYFVLLRQHVRKYRNLFVSYVIGLVASLYLIPSLYYFYTTGFGIESVVLDIVLFGVSVIQMYCIIFVICIYHSKFSIDKIICFLVLFLIVGMMTVFTMYPPDFPIFVSKGTGIISSGTEVNGIYLRPR